MASRSTHPVGKPAGLSPADLQRHAKPAAYLTRASRVAIVGLRDLMMASWTPGIWRYVRARFAS
jgi:hypothetical protein